MPEPIVTLSESIDGIFCLRENLTSISAMLDDQFDDLQTLYDHLQEGVIDISRILLSNRLFFFRVWSQE